MANAPKGDWFMGIRGLTPTVAVEQESSRAQWAPRHDDT